MSSRSSKVRVAATLALALAACTEGETPSETPQPPAPVADSGRRLVVGDIDANDPVRKFEAFKPFADHLAGELAALGISGGEVRIAPDMETMISWLASGDVDLYVDSLYPAMVVSSRSGAVPLLRRWKGGAAEYHTVFLTLPGTGVASVDDLPNRLVAFDDEASTSGFFLPFHYLRSRGLEPVRHELDGAVPLEDRAGYVFTGDDENSVQWLLSGRVAAAAIDNITLGRDIAPEARERFVVLAQTDPVPRQVLLARADLDPTLRATIVETLLRLQDTAAGSAALESIDTARFDEFPEGPQEALARFAKAYATVRDGLDR